MIIKNALHQLKEIVRGLRVKNIEERLQSYITITVLFSRLEDITKDQTIPNYKIYKHDLLLSCEVLCGLDDSNGHSEEQHIGWALSAVDKLGSIHCFNVDNHYI
jgi:hypothetical protein